MCCCSVLQSHLIPSCSTGHYMYIETSAPHHMGQKARLISPQITTTGQQCFTFFYNLFGHNIGAFNIYVMTGSTLNISDTPVWSKSANYGSMWVAGQTTVQASQPYKVGHSDADADVTSPLTSLISYMFTLPPRQLRSSSDDRLFCVPHIRTKSYGQRSFAYQGANTWNQLPLSVRHSQSLASFKTKLKTHLFPKWIDLEAEYATTLSIFFFFLLLLFLCILRYLQSDVHGYSE